MAKLILGNVFLLLVIAVTNSNALQLGTCPFVRPQADLNATGFLGKWYEYSKYSIAAESLSKCITIQFEELPNETLAVERTLTGVLTDIQVGFTGTANLTQPGVFELRPDSWIGFPGNTKLYILGTDYSNYAVIYFCNEIFNLGVLHQRYAFVLTREKEPSQELVDTAQNALKNNGLSVRNLKVTDQVDCPENH